MTRTSVKLGFLIMELASKTHISIGFLTDFIKYLKIVKPKKQVPESDSILVNLLLINTMGKSGPLTMKIKKEAALQ